MHTDSAEPRECFSLAEVMRAFNARTMDELVTSLEAVADDDVHLLDLDETGFEILIQGIGSRVEYPTSVSEVVSTIDGLVRTVSDMWEAADSEMEPE